MFDPEDLIYVFKLKRAKVRGKNLMASCPLGEHSDKHPSFGINLENSKWHCYSCGEKGSNIRTLAYKMRIVLPDSLMMQSLAASPAKLQRDKTIKTYPMDDTFDNYSQAYKELKDRGISKSALKRFKVGYDRGSVKFPCILPNGKLYGWVERNKKWDGRYGVQPEGVHRKVLLFGLDRKIKDLYLTESVTDMLKLVTWHYEAVATCGNMIFEEQMRVIVSNCERVILVPQNDVPAKKWIIDAKKLFKGKIKVFGVSVNKDYKDVCSDGYTKEMWEEDLKGIRFLF